VASHGGASLARGPAAAGGSSAVARPSGLDMLDMLGAGTFGSSSSHAAGGGGGGGAAAAADGMDDDGDDGWFAAGTKGKVPSSADMVLVKGIVEEVLAMPEFESLRSAQMDQDDILALLAAFNARGLHFT